jgi:hypothetical protein
LNVALSDYKVENTLVQAHSGRAKCRNSMAVTRRQSFQQAAPRPVAADQGNAPRVWRLGATFTDQEVSSGCEYQPLRELQSLNELGLSRALVRDD